MPYHSDEIRRPHLEFVRESIDTERRRRRGFPGPRPERGGRGVFGQQLQQAADRLEQEQLRKPRPLRGINPRLVFRIPFVTKPDYDKIVELFDRAGMSVVSVEADGAIVVFQETVSLQSFRNQIDSYQAGPRQRLDGKQAVTSQYDVLEFIDLNGMRSWTREDRIGPRLAALIGPQAIQLQTEALYVVELELWHPGTSVSARRLLSELRTAYQTNAVGDERWLDEYVGSTLLLAKIRTSGAHLDQLLAEDIIATIDLPFVATFDVRQAARATERSFPIPPAPPADGPRLCVIDSGIVSNHPLLRPYVGHEEAILTRDATVADMNGHGTRVGALAVYGDIRACYERGYFESTITLYSARVLNEQNAFDDEELIINQLRRAVEIFVRPPYVCHIFNVSIGSHEPALGNDQRRQNLYGEILDTIAREYQVLFVVAAGNHDEVTRAASVEEALNTYPAPLLHPRARLCDFATTALGLTVGALGESASLAIRTGMNAQDIVRPIALRDEPAPMTRVGPGVQGAIKPEFVHYGGSPVFDRNRPDRFVSDLGMEVMSFSHEPLNRLFAYDNGTSYASPRVARLAALVEHQLRQQLDVAPHPNLIRAILAASARIPEAARTALEGTGDPHATIKVCGYGLPDEEYVLQSADGRVVMYAQATIQLDHLHIYRVPVPDCLLQATGLRSITVALAFDPAVNARRLDYLGAEMDFRLIRGKTLDEVYQAYRRLQSGEDPENAVDSSYEVTFEPRRSTKGTGGYSRKKSTLQCGTFAMKGLLRKNYGNDYWLVVRAERRWVTDEQATQSYAVVVALEAATSELYAQVRQRIRQRVRVRV